MFTCGTRLQSSTANSATPANTKHIRGLSYLFYIPFGNPPFKPTGNVALSYIDKHVGSNPNVAAIANASEVTKVPLMMLRLERDSNWYRTDLSSTTMTIRPLLCYLAMMVMSSREGRRQS
ncbi:hypothetical protein F2Q69_00046408 [Brassica cretica]|uniref:Uncharacterized protein n=1 Tax=Brassica cretica TaxID=69181 RepID=A0A8S9PQP3_BRACR|nr:hypothetical protein F2Q69_00046408 [Brassica cretica]